MTYIVASQAKLQVVTPQLRLGYASAKTTQFSSRIFSQQLNKRIKAGNLPS